MTKSECLEELVREIQRLYRGLPRHNRTSESKDFELHSKLLTACEEDPDCSMACMLPAKTFQALIVQLRASISLSIKVQKSQTTAHYTVNGYENERFCTDQERIKLMADFKSKTLRLTGRKYTGPEIRQFLSDFEGLEPVQEIPDNFSHFHVTQDDEESDDLEDFFRTGNLFSDSQTETTSEVYSDFFPTLRGKVDGYTAVVSLRDKSIEHLLTQSRPYLRSRYFSLKFEGILIDTGAAKVSTAEYNQFLALKRLRPTFKTDNSRAGEAHIIFGIGSTSSLGTTDVDTPVGTITFYITNSVTPFLFYLLTQHSIIGEEITYVVIRKYGHPFLLLGGPEESLVHSYEKLNDIIEFHLTDTELRRLHRRFGHPSADSLAKFSTPLVMTSIDKQSNISQRFCHCDVHHNKTGPNRSTPHIGLVERYHTPLRRAYEVISKDLGGTKIDRTSLLQMAVKAINNTAGPDGMQAAAIKSAMKKDRKICAQEQIRDALKMRNGSITSELKDVPPNGQVLVWRENKEWTGPYKLIRIEGEDCIVQVGDHMPKFRSTSVKPYYSDKNAPNSNKTPLDEEPNENNLLSNKNSEIIEPRRSNRIRKLRNFGNFFVSICNLVTISSFNASSFLSSKEVADREISIRLRVEDKITTPGKPFEASRKKELDDLITKRIFDFIPKASVIHGGERIFSARVVDTIKYNYSVPYEKSRLVRLVLALAPSLTAQGYNLILRDITQAYVQASTSLNRRVIVRPPRDISHQFPVDKLLLMLKPLYGIPESGNHWWNTYHKYHLQRLLMRSSTFDPCLLISTTKEAFGIVDMQVDDTLGLMSPEFAKRENEEIRKAKFMAKPFETVSPNKSISFNGTKIEMKNKNIYVLSKGQTESIRLVNENSVTAKDEYRSQRARGAYLASICQPEASYGLSAAAQHKNPTLKTSKN
ncbi:hypothetical protein EPUL_004318 [Erysiphe pulchra]|uniref:Reverse transcriptase Ty1/copia-type domain-containing protein n=1 Tax=Erysiphe pulchra TaxID=225359 RepID=A0A2S4PSZ1_9PEZI|nr:hypothetical protein EPUL_004318 [Erysiphe pulchra]